MTPAPMTVTWVGEGGARICGGLSTAIIIVVVDAVEGGEGEWWFVR